MTIRSFFARLPYMCQEATKVFEERGRDKNKSNISLRAELSLSPLLHTAVDMCSYRKSRRGKRIRMNVP